MIREVLDVNDDGQLDMMDAGIVLAIMVSGYFLITFIRKQI